MYEAVVEEDPPGVCDIASVELRTVDGITPTVPLCSFRFLFLFPVIRRQLSICFAICGSTLITFYSIPFGLLVDSQLVHVRWDPPYYVSVSLVESIA